MDINLTKHQDQNVCNESPINITFIGGGALNPNKKTWAGDMENKKTEETTSELTKEQLEMIRSCDVNLRLKDK